jgi:hypothetical protein
MPEQTAHGPRTQYPCGCAFVVREWQQCPTHAAALDLLASLAALLDGGPPAGEPGHIDYAQAVAMARAAIARARGCQPIHGQLPVCTRCGFRIPSGGRVCQEAFGVQCSPPEDD